MTDKLKYLINGDVAVCVGRTPGRGFYHIYTYELNKIENEEDWIWCLRREESLALLMIDIGAASDRDLSEEELDKLDRILTLFKENDFRMIVRIVYDRVGNGMLSEPNDPIIIFRHMMQTGEILRKYSQYILTFQGLFAGSWGEMHSSKFMGDDNLVLFFKRLRKSLGNDINISVRRPQMIDCIKKVLPEEKIGLFDDAILGSGNDLGTWSGSLSKEIIECLTEVSSQSPVSGEIMAGARNYSCQQIDEHLKLLGVNCLDAVYDADSVLYLKELGLDSKLGYRYEVSRVATDVYRVKNTGYAPAYVDLELELFDEDSLEKIATIKISALELKSGEEKEYRI